ncbi:MAG: GNAT family N-acetyltransferase [Thalassotalea sp.]|nr:GNAT family N-acetyltransferase [Thalassotalea sp.]
MKIEEFKLVTCTLLHLESLRTWCVNKKELEQWAGPNFRFPHSSKTFLEDIKLQELDSYALVNKNNELIAFGQFYERLAHCHLGRLIVNPSFRGQGVAKSLIQELSIMAKKTLKLPALSLFVYANNTTAIALYKKLGFIEKDYPEEMPLKNCLYLTNIDKA